MKQRAFTAAAALVVVVVAHAQAPAPAAWTPRLTADGQPDLQGLWNRTVTSQDIEEHGAEGLNIQAGPSLVVDTPEQVDSWHAWLKEAGVALKSSPRTHRDGARSFYCADPDGNTVQIIFHPPISGKVV